MNKNNRKIYKSSVEVYKLKVLAVTDTGSIITSGSDNFDYGVIFQHGILYDSMPLPIDISSTYAASNIKKGMIVKVRVNSITIMNGCRVAILNIEISGKNAEEDDVYRRMTVGEKYHVTIYDYNDHYVTLRVPGTSLRGYIDAKAINRPEVGQEYDLRLSKKGNSVFQFLTFELDVRDAEDTGGQEDLVDVDALYQNMFRQEVSLISEEDEVFIKDLLTNYPHTDRYKRFLADVTHLYCRCTPQAYMAYEEFCKHYPKYLEDHNFFITCNLEEMSFTIFDSEYVVFKLYTDGDCLWLREFYYGKKDIRAKYICDRNRKRKLIIEGHKIHILDSFNAIPHDFDWRGIMAYINRMADFYYLVLKRINTDYLEKQNADTKEFVVLRDLIEFEKEIEKRKEGKIIRINNQSKIERTIALEYDPGTAYNFKLAKSDYDKLCGIMDPDEDLFVSLFDPQKDDRPIRNGKLFYDESTSIARIEFRKDTERDLLTIVR